MEKDFLEKTESEQERKILQAEITRLKDELAMQNNIYKKAMDVREIEKNKTRKRLAGKIYLFTREYAKIKRYK